MTTKMSKLLILLLSAVFVFGKNPIKVPLRNIGGRIFGGETAKLGQFPFQAALIIDTTEGGRIFCGGSLITQKHILTAAHCTIDAKNITAYLGLIDLNNWTEKITYISSKITTHPSYDASTLKNDIGVIELSQNVTFSSNIKSIVVDYDFIDSNLPVTVSGFGKTDDIIADLSEFLQYTTLQTISNSDCGKIYNDIQTGVLCANGNHSESTCSGDSGGPLIRISGSDVAQVGIVSFGPQEGCSLGYPAGFTRVSEYKSFITKATGNAVNLKILYSLELLLLMLLFLYRKLQC